MMKITRRQLRSIIRESTDRTKQKVQKFNRDLSRMYDEIMDGVIEIEYDSTVEYADNPEVDAALEDIKAAMLRLKKALFVGLEK